MKKPEKPENEQERMEWLNRLEILDTFEEKAYDDLTYLAAQICGTPIALVSLVDNDRQWFKSRVGLEAQETPREVAFCAHAILEDSLFVVPNADQDSRFVDNPLVTGAPHVKFYAGAPLILKDNIRLGTLCVIDHKAKTISSSQREALEALARQVISQLELRLKVRDLEYMNNVKDEFVSMVNHELRTPLTSIRGALGMLVQQRSPLFHAESSTLIDIAYRNTDRLLFIVNDILDLAKIDSGKIQLILGHVNIATLAETAQHMNQPYCEKCHCTLDIVLPDNVDQCLVIADEQRLMQVVSNLISNAAKFSNPGDRVELKVWCENGFVHLSVTDHGPGIPEDKKSQIFQRFSNTSHKDNRNIPSTGLGLHLCKKLVELHHGEIDFESMPNHHTTFFIRFNQANVVSRAA